MTVNEEEEIGPVTTTMYSILKLLWTLNKHISFHYLPLFQT